MLQVFRCTTIKRFGVTFIEPKTTGLKGRPLQLVKDHSIAILGAGRTDEVVMTFEEFKNMRVGCFRLLYKVLGKDMSNEERLVRAIGSTSDEMFGRVLMEKPKETLAAVRAWMERKSSMEESRKNAPQD